MATHRRIDPFDLNSDHQTRPTASADAQRAAGPTPDSSPSAQPGTDKPDTRPINEHDLRDRILAEVQEQAALEKYQRERPDLWLHVQRLARLMAMQDDLEDHLFPSGSCFLHTALPDQQTFSLRRVLEINLETSTVTVEIHEDAELEPGIAVLPVECITWFGFPAEAIPLTFQMRGLILPDEIIRSGPTTGETDAITRTKRRKPDES